MNTNSIAQLAEIDAADERAGNGRDTFTSKGASDLKARIEAYWRERGYEVEIELADGPFHPAIRSARTDVRSDMVNGMPRKIKKA